MVRCGVSTDTTSTRPEAPAGRSLPRRAAAFVTFVVGRVLVDPVRAGRLRDTGWPPGLKAIVLVALVLYAVVMGFAVFGGAIRSFGDLAYRAPAETFPTVALPVVLIAMIFTCSCLFAASLHLVWWLRPIVLLVVLGIVLRPLDLSQDHWTNWVFLAAAVALVLLLVVRWNRTFRWWEFIVSVVIFGHAFVADVAFRNELYAGFAVDLRLNSLSLIMLVMWAFATPAALVAGSAMAELTISAVTWTVTALARALVSRRTAVVCLVLVVVASGWRFLRSGYQVFLATEPDSPGSFLVGVAMTVVVLGGCLVVTRVRARTPGPVVPVAVDHTLAAWTRRTLPMALLLSACMLGLSQLNQLLTSFGLGAVGQWLVGLGGTDQIWYLTALLGIGAVVWAVRAARQDRRDATQVWATFGMLLLVATANTLLGLAAALSGILTAITVLVLAGVGVLLVRGEWRSRSIVGLATVAVLAVAFEYREYIFEPVTALFTVTGVAAGLLVGLLWRLLTDNEYSHGDSPRFPRPSRVLLALANATMGVTAAAMVSLLGGHWELDLTRAEDIGDTLLGNTLLFATVYGVLHVLRRPANQGHHQPPGIPAGPPVV